MAIMGKMNVGSADYLVGSSLYGTCDTSPTTVAKVAVISGFDSDDCMIPGITVHIKFTNNNGANNPTLAIKSSSSATTTTTAKSIKRYGTTAPSSTSNTTSWNAGAVISLTYDGTYWQMNDWLNTDTNTTYTLSTSGNNITLTSSSSSVQKITAPYATSAGSGTDSTKLPKSWTAVANSAYNYTTAPADAAPWGTVITGNAALKTANEVMVQFTNNRISPIILYIGKVASYSTFASSVESYKLCVGAIWDKTNGAVQIRCTANGWGYSSVPVGVAASSIFYR